jgi:hypothetical protein
LPRLRRTSAFRPRTSRTSSVSHSQPQPELFVDRSLGRHRVAEVLRKAGWTLRTHHEVYGGRDEEVPDVELLQLCGREGLAHPHEGPPPALSAS